MTNEMYFSSANNAHDTLALSNTNDCDVLSEFGIIMLETLQPAIKECALQYMTHYLEPMIKQFVEQTINQYFLKLTQFLVGRFSNLDNLIPAATDMSKEDNDMSKKIRRPIMIQGVKHWICGDTEQEYAENLMKAMTGGTIATPPAETKKHNFREYATDWFNTFSKPNIEDTTAITYERQLNRHIIPVIGNMDVEDITPNSVQAIFNKMGDTAKDTKNKVKIVLNQILEKAIEDDLILKNPLKSKSVRITGKNPQYTELYSVEQMQYIVKNIGNVKAPQDRAYLALHALHPFRLEELLGLKGADIDDKYIYIKRAVTHPDRNQPIIKDTKEAVSVRRIDLVQQIAQYLPETAPDEFIIGGKKPLSYTQVRRMCERIQKDIGFEDKITPIRFRTTLLTDLYDQTKDMKLAQAAAGHARPDITGERYARGRTNNFNSANPIAAAYGLAN